MSFSLFSYGQNNANDLIGSTLLEKSKENKTVDCLITFSQKANLSTASSFKKKISKTKYVYDQLKKTSNFSQRELIKFLEKEKIEFNSFLIVNAVSAKLNFDQIKKICLFSGIKSIDWDPDINLETIKQHAPTKNNVDAEWGIQMINADSVWQLGYQGQNVTVGGQDTGYDWQHPVLIQKYKGFQDSLSNHNYSWHDAIHEINPMNNDSTLDPSHNPCGINSPFPCDDNNHGTHTMGTMIGSDTSNLIGVAPLSKWIACRNMERGAGKPSTYLECFEWFLAPTNLQDTEPRPELAPDVINNSWSCPADEGCNESNWALMREAVTNLKAAGVFVVVSAGNSGGNGCGSVSRAPAIFKESFVVGSTRSDDTISGFSSRGPVTIDSSFILKPDVSAPGQQVRSSIRNGGFAAFSGTSMAGPHVAGVVALIISANPELRGQVEIIESILKDSAVPKTDSSECVQVSSSGLNIPNHIYGHGRIDALAAVQIAISLSDTKEISPYNPWYIYPNPNNGTFQIQFTNPNFDDLEGRVYDIHGRMVFNIDNIDKIIKLNHLPNGIYYLQLNSGEQSLIQKFILQR